MLHDPLKRHNISINVTKTKIVKDIHFDGPIVPKDMDWLLI